MSRAYYCPSCGRLASEPCEACEKLRAEVERLGSAAEALEAEMKRITAYLKEPCMFSEPCDLCRTKAKVLAVVNARGEVRR